MGISVLQLKLSSTGKKRPWINTHIKHLTRKRQRSSFIQLVWCSFKVKSSEGLILEPQETLLIRKDAYIVLEYIYGSNICACGCTDNGILCIDTEVLFKIVK